MADKDLLADMEKLRAHHEFTRDRIGQEGCAVRLQAAHYVETIERAIASMTAHQANELGIDGDV